MLVSWTEIKNFIDNRNVNLQYLDLNTRYYLRAADGWFEVECELDKNATDTTDLDDFENNYKSSANMSIKDRDTTGREIIRTAATVKGWHYQAHAIEFETSKLNSIYNKDVNGNDLGFASIKFYDTNDNELTTQVNIDSSCVKTVLTWNASYDMELISGQLRQITRQDSDIYMYVQAKVLVAPATYLTVPFTQGGINMRYIGADEPLMTDGRASKLLSSNDHFEVVCKHDAGIQHKMTIIFETYKSPV